MSGAPDPAVTTFCCQGMQDAVDHPGVAITYSAKFNEFGVRFLNEETGVITLDYCPWCGQLLPESLRDAWFEEMERRGIDPWLEDVPAEFTDDRWYRKP